jgi:hypothetical protein
MLMLLDYACSPQVYHATRSQKELQGVREGAAARDHRPPLPARSCETLWLHEPWFVLKFPSSYWQTRF